MCKGFRSAALAFVVIISVYKPARYYVWKICKQFVVLRAHRPRVGRGAIRGRHARHMPALRRVVTSQSCHAAAGASTTTTSPQPTLQNHWHLYHTALPHSWLEYSWGGVRYRGMVPIDSPEDLSWALKNKSSQGSLSKQHRPELTLKCLCAMSRPETFLKTLRSRWTHWSKPFCFCNRVQRYQIDILPLVINTGSNLFRVPEKRWDIIDRMCRKIF